MALSVLTEAIPMTAVTGKLEEEGGRGHRADEISKWGRIGIYMEMAALTSRTESEKIREHR